MSIDGSRENQLIVAVKRQNWKYHTRKEAPYVSHLVIYADK